MSACRYPIVQCCAILAYDIVQTGSLVSTFRTNIYFLISNFRRVPNVVCYLLYGHIKFRRRGITQKKAYNIYFNTENLILARFSFFT